MAKYRLTSPDGRKFEVTAPDDADEKQVLDYFQKEAGRIEAPEGADRALRRTVSKFTMGLGNIPLDAFTAATKAATGEVEGGYSGEYRRQRQKTRAADEPSLDVADVAADTAGLTGQAFATLPLTATLKAAELAKMSAQEVRKHIGRESGRFGAAFGFGGGYAAAPEDAGVGETLAEQGKHAAGGYVLGRAIPAAINAFGDYVSGPVRNFLTQRQTARAERATGVAQDYAEAGVPEFTPALGGPTVQSTASGLQGTVFGGSIRESAGKSLEALEAQIIREIEAAGGKATPAEVGERIQQFLRQQVAERSTPKETVEGMSPMQLQDISGVAPEQGYSPKPPRVEPTPARPVERVTPEGYLQEVERAVPEVPPRQITDLNVPEPTIEDVPLPPELGERVREAAGRVSQALMSHNQEVASFRRLEDQLRAEKMTPHGIKSVQWQDMGEGFKHYVVQKENGALYADWQGRLMPGQQASPQEAADIAAIVGHLNKQKPSATRFKETESRIQAMNAERDSVAKEAEEYRKAQLPALLEQRRAQALAAAESEAGAEAALATQKARAEAVEQARPSAVKDAMMRNKKAEGAEEARAMTDTQVRQAQSDVAFERELAERKARPGELAIGKSKESYPTEFDAAYAAVRQQRPAVQANLLGKKQEDVQTSTGKLMERLAVEARGKTQMRGFKEGQLFDEEGRMRPALLDYLRPRLGDEVTNALAYFSEHRAKNLFTPAMQGKQDIRTMVGQAIRDADGTALNKPMLQRLYRAVDEDIERFAVNAGQKGQQYRQQREAVDAAYKDFQENIKAPLAKVLGDDVDPAVALTRLIKSTKDGGEIEPLRAFYRVAKEKGDVTRATGWLLNDMTRDGLEGFLKGYRALSPDARQLMFQGPAAAMGKNLDRLARVGGTLERFAKTARDGANVDLTKAARPGNLLAAVVGYVSMPALIKGAVAAKGADKLLASKQFAAWMKRFPVERGAGSHEWQKHMLRLRAMLTENTDLNRDAINTVMGSFLSSAKAFPLGSDARQYQPVESEYDPAHPDSTGSEWTDRNSRVREAQNFDEKPSTWNPVKPDERGRDSNSFKPGMYNDLPYPDPVLGDPAFRQKTKGRRARGNALMERM